MNKAEIEYFRKKEDQAYREMQNIGSEFGRQGTLFQIARGKWVTWHEICSKFEIKEIIE